MIGVCKLIVGHERELEALCSVGKLANGYKDITTPTCYKDGKKVHEFRAFPASTR